MRTWTVTDIDGLVYPQMQLIAVDNGGAPGTGLGMIFRSAEDGTVIRKSEAEITSMTVAYTEE